MQTQDLQKILDYHVWATQQILSTIEKYSISLKDVFQLLNHLLGAENIWLCRIEGRPLPQPVFPDFEIISEFRQGFDETSRKWQSLINTSKLEESLKYLDLKGTSYQSVISDIVFHVFNHATYHRGQISAKIRAAGFQLAATDFIVFSRVTV
jgi:uncharacterized damage-inducible protein DinB